MAQRLVLTLVMDAKVNINVVSDILKNLQNYKELTFYIVFSAGTSAGAIQIESAHDSAFAGTWAAEGAPITWAAATSVKSSHITALHQALRLRISTAIVGGSVSIYVIGGD